MTFANTKTTEVPARSYLLGSQNNGGHLSLLTAQYFLSLALCHCAPTLQVFPQCRPLYIKVPHHLSLLGAFSL